MQNGLLGLMTFLWLAPAAAAEPRMTPELLWKLGRVSQGAVSPEGDRIVYVVRRFDLAEDSGTSEIHVANADGQEDRVLTSGLKDASSLQWGRGAVAGRLFYVGLRSQDQDAKPQVWSLEARAGSEPVQVTSIVSGVANLKVSPTGTHLAFTVDVKLDATVNELYADLPKADARIIDSLMYRHWNAWHDFAYSHLHVAPLAGNESGAAVDLMQGLRADCPLPPFGGAEQFSWSPDGRELAYTAKVVNNPAESTDSGIYIVPREGGRARCITPGRPGYDNYPSYSPDGRYIAFHSMQRPSFEADRNRIMRFDRTSGEIRELTAGWDQTTHAATWLPDSQSLLFVSETRGTEQVFRVSVQGGTPTQVSRGRHNWSLAGLFPDGHSAIVAQQSMLRPDELARLQLADGTHTLLTHVNDDLYAGLETPQIEERWVRATDGESIHNWVLFPPGFDPSRKWPMIVYCQGGPQSQVGQAFSYRWNFHLMAAQGYVVLAVNRRGLPGFGQNWTDQISGDWGGQAMQDILAATDDMMLESYIDRQRVAAVGASFGGYTVYWLMGHHAGRYCCMISHCGVFNLESMYGSTEELFFPNWDLGGPYWKSPQLQRDYNRFSPHRFIGNWKTPLLVIHGEKDFRVPITQGLEAFTAAQVEGIPSRFLYFPNEGHWVTRPQNSVLWQRVFFDWLRRHCEP